VDGRAVKGPTEPFCEHARIAPSASGIADTYSGLIDGIVADELVTGLPGLVTGTLMSTPADRARLAREVLDFSALLHPTR
jgi:LPPG:FO 2-phospho-L-lactate transferase